MSSRFAGIPKECVRDPYLANHVAVEHEQFNGTVKLKSAVVPSLSKEDVNGVFLQLS